MAHWDRVLTKVGVKKASTWMTAVDADETTNQIDVESIDISVSYDRAEDLSLNGGLTQRIDQPGTIDLSGTMRCLFDFENHDKLIAGFFGTSGTPAQVAATSAYTNTLSLNNSLTGIFYSMIIETTVDLWEIFSLTFTDFRVIFEFGKPVMVEYDFLAAGLGFDQSTPWPATATVATTLTFQNSPPPVHSFNAPNGVTFWWNSDSGALDSGDVIYPDSATLTYSRPMRSIFTGQHSPWRSEPVNDGFGQWGLSLNFPVYDTTTYIEDSLTGSTTRKMSVSLDGDTDSIESGQDYNYTFLFPLLQIKAELPSGGGPGVATQTVNGFARLATSNPTGMADTIPYITLKNKRTSTPLA